MVVGDVHLVLVNRAGRVLFGQRQNTGYEDGAWHLPSGHLEAGESVVAALIREAKEEVGIVIEERDVEFSHVMHNSSAGWHELPDRLIPYCRTALESIASDYCFSTFGWWPSYPVPAAQLLG